MSKMGTSPLGDRSGRPLCRETGKEASGESWLNHKMMPLTMGTNDSAPLKSFSAC